MSDKRITDKTTDAIDKLTTAAEIAHVATSTLDLDLLLTRSVELILEKFGFYYASIFLAEPGTNDVVLHESSGQAGRQLKASHYKITIGSTSLIGLATSTRKPVIVQNVANNPNHLKNPLLPDTRAEAVIPLLCGEVVIGALDIQSTTIDSFSDSDITILNILADQLATAIQNARLYVAVQKELAERKAAEQSLQKIKNELEIQVQARIIELSQTNENLQKELLEHKRIDVELKEGQTRYRNLFEGVPVGLYRSTPEGSFLDANEVIAHMFGYPDRESLLNSSAYDIYLKPEYRQRWQEQMDKEGVVRNFDSKMRKLDGSIIWGRDTARTVRDEAGRILYYEGSLEDITERKQAEEELQRYREHLEELVAARTTELTTTNEQLQQEIIDRKSAEDKLQARQRFLTQLNDITHAALETSNFSTMLQMLADQSGELFHADGANIALWDDSTGAPLPVAASSPELRETYKTLRLAPDDVTMTASVLQAGHVLVADDVAHSPYISAGVASQFPARSLMGLPLIAGDQKLGAVLIMFNQPHHFTSDEIARGEQAARLIALAVAMAKLLDELEQRVADRTSELAAERTLLRTLIDNVPDEIYIKDDQGRFLNANITVAQVYRLSSPDELIGKTDFDLAPSHEDGLLSYNAERAIIQTGEPMINRETHNPDKTRWRLETKIPLRNGEGQIIGLVGVNRFITERKQAEMLQEVVYQIAQATNQELSLQELAATIHQSIQKVMLADNFYIAILDAETDLVNYLYEVDQFDEDVPLVKNGKSMTAYVLRTGRSLLCTKSIHQQLVNAGEIELVGSPSSIWLGVPLIIQGEIIGVMAVQDYQNEKAYEDREKQLLEYVSSQVAISIQRKQTEEALASSEAELRTLFASMHDVVMVIDHNGVYLKVAPTNPSLLYKPTEDLVGKHIQDLFPPEQAVNFVNTIQKVLETKQTHKIEYKLVINGNLFWFEASVSLLTPDSTLWVARDISARKRAEKKYRDIFENSAEGIYQSTPEGRYLTANPALARMFGYDSPEELMKDTTNLNYNFYVNPNRRAEFQQILNEQGALSDFESEVYRKDGSTIWISERAHAVRDKDGNLLYYEGTDIDITAGKHAEEALHASEERYRLLFEKNPLPMWVYDRETLEFLAVNDSAVTHYGYSREQFLSMTIMDIRPVKELDRLEANLIQKEKEREQSGSWKHQKQDGTLIDVEIISHAITFLNQPARLVLANDITEQKKAEDALRVSEERFRSLYENATIGIYRTTPDGRILLANPALVAMVGHSSFEELSRRNLEEKSNKLGDERTLFRQLIEKDGIVSGLEAAWIKKDGTTIFVRESAKVIRDNEGKIMYYEGVVEDISKRKEAEAALQESEERYTVAVRGANDGLWDWNLKTNDVYYSPRWKSMLGYEEDDVGNSSEEWFKRVHPDDLIRLKSELNAHLDGNSALFQSEHRMLHINGKYLWMLSRGLAIRDAQGHVHRIAGSQTDITIRKQAEEQLEHDALHDALTGLPNRTLFIDRLEHSVKRIKRSGQSMFAVMFLDIDRFKLINDSLGHAYGDQLLIRVAECLQKCLRPGDTVARLGGDEFVILLEEINEVADTTRVADRIQESISQLFNLNEHQFSISASIGITLSSLEYQNVEDMIRDADTAMYRAKTSGKAHYEIFDINMHLEVTTLLNLEADLRHALQYEEFKVFYQPLISVKTGKITGTEALLRWQHPTRGLIPPVEFITTLEETGMIIPVGEWVLRTACRQNKIWQENGYPDLKVSVNFSTRQFQFKDLPELIKNVLQETGMDPKTLEMEITESTAILDTEMSINLLNQIHSLGVSISLDDFGSGYSALSYLNRYPFNTLKIDRSFISKITSNINDDATLTKAIIALGKSLNLFVVAEGVETREQVSFLQQNNCDSIQGYLFSRPVEPSELTGLLKKQNFL